MNHFRAQGSPCRGTPASSPTGLTEPASASDEQAALHNPDMSDRFDNWFGIMRRDDPRTVISVSTCSRTGNTPKPGRAAESTSRRQCRAQPDRYSSW